MNSFDLIAKKNKMFNCAFIWREKGITISQKSANKLNNMLRDIQDELEKISYYDSCIDYYIDFDSFVKENKYYNNFAW